MAYTVEVERLHQGQSESLYAHSRNEQRDGYFLVDTSARNIYPCDSAGVRSSEMTFIVDSSELVDPDLDDERRNVFLEAIPAIVFHMREGNELPQTAHRHFE